MGFIRDTLGLVIAMLKDALTPSPPLLGDIMAGQGPRSKETMLADMEETIDHLKELGVEITAEPRIEKIKPLFKDDPDRFYVVIDLPFDKTSDYFFSLDVHDDGQRDITAILLNKETGGSQDVLFWDSNFEIWDHYYSLEELVADFHKNLRLVVENETQVIMSDSHGMWAFDCIAKVDGKWQKVKGGSLALRDTGFKFPKIKGLRKTFAARPLVSERK